MADSKAEKKEMVLKPSNEEQEKFPASPWKDLFESTSDHKLKLKEGQRLSYGGKVLTPTNCLIVEINEGNGSIDVGSGCPQSMKVLLEAEKKEEKKEEKKDEKEEAKKMKMMQRDVVIHPMVLLSVVDHYNRVAKGSSKRVVGTLLGEIYDLKIHITNCFGVPFEEDTKDPKVWFLDHNFHEAMFAMFKKVNQKERVVGWYSTGPKIKPSDLGIHEIFRKYVPEPIFVVMDVQPKDIELPMEAYYSVQENTADEVFKRTFLHVNSSVGAFEAEEVGVEHLLRDIKNASASTLAVRVGDKITALKGLSVKLDEIEKYLGLVAEGKLPMNQEIIYQLQEIFNLLPDQDSEDLVRSFALETNDMMLALYLGSMLRSTVALHNLINNKIRNKKAKEEKSKEKKEKKDEKDDKKGDNKENAGDDKGKDSKEDKSKDKEK